MTLIKIRPHLIYIFFKFRSAHLQSYLYTMHDAIKKKVSIVQRPVLELMLFKWS